MDAGAKAGAIQGSKIFLPRQGILERIEEFDFMLSYTHPSMSQLGKNVDHVCITAELEKEQAAADLVYDCSNAVVYSGKLIRRAK